MESRGDRGEHAGLPAHPSVTCCTIAAHLAPRLRSILSALLLSLSCAGGPVAFGAPVSVDHITTCSDGFAAGYACSRVDLAANVGLSALGATAGQDGNDLWGWTDPLNGREYALMGVGNGTVFVDISSPDHPTVLGLLPTHTSNSLWRDIKVYADHAFIVSEAVGHGLQVFDLKRLRSVVSPPVSFTADAHYGGFGRAHNVAINEDSGFAYVVGSRQGTTQCSGGLHMIDIRNPVAPSFAGCFSSDGYTHDTQCVIYQGPDLDYVGREICFSSNEDTLTIVDVSDKSAPLQIARAGYAGVGYAHQGWLTPDQRWFLMNDELDELNFGHNTRTYVWDLQDLDNPQQTFAYTAAVAATDHNLYIRDQYAFLANYKSGLRILDLSGIAQADIREVAFFDTYPANDSSGFDGAWSVYPFFDSGTVVVSDISRGLFVLRPQLCEEPAVVQDLSADDAGINAIALNWSASPQPGVSYEVYRELGGCGAGPGELIAEALASPAYLDLSASGQVEYGYRVRAVAAGGQCRSAYSACAVASTGGQCDAPPQFAGLAVAGSSQTARCGVDLSWAAASPSCAGPVRFEVHRSVESDFLPGASTRIRTGLDALTLRDHDVASGVTYHYLVRARDEGNEAQDQNLVRRSVTVSGPQTDGTWRNGAEQGESFLGGSGIAPMHVAWHTSDDVAHSGERSYFSGYVNSTCVALTSPPIDLGSLGASELGYFQRYGIESGWDGGRVEISSDGSDWMPLVPQGGYPQQITNSGNACGWPVGTGVFAGTALDWHEARFDLSGRSGSVQIRWVMGTDGAVAEQGWWVDTISVSPARVEGSCETVPWTTSLFIAARDPESSLVGSAVRVAFLLNVDPDEGAAPEGIVQIQADGAGERCEAVLPDDSCELVLLSAGQRSLEAHFAGDAVFPAASDSVLHTVVDGELAFRDGFEAQALDR